MTLIDPNAPLADVVNVADTSAPAPAPAPVAAPAVTQTQATAQATDPDAYQLRYPIKSGTNTITEVSLRRGTVRDLKQARRMAEQNKMDVDICLTSVLSVQKLTPEDVMTIDIADFNALSDRFSGVISFPNTAPAA